MSYYSDLALDGARPTPTPRGSLTRPVPSDTQQVAYCVCFSRVGTSDWYYTTPVATSGAAYQERARLKRHGMRASVLWWNVREQMWIG